MTRDEVLAMEPGRELDKLVDRIMKSEEETELLDSMTWHAPTGVVERPYAPYSTDLAAAWRVVEKMRAECVFVDIFSTSDSYNVIINEGDAVNSQTAPEAICKAALLAVLDL